MEQSTLGLNIHPADVSSHLPLPYADDGIRAGFPSPAQAYLPETIDLNQELVSHPAATFYGKVVGDSMCEEGIEDGDILVIDRSLEPVSGDLAVCCLDGEFTLKRISIDKGRVLLVPSNPKYKPIEVTEDNELIVWGIVTYTIKKNRRKR